MSLNLKVGDNVLIHLKGLFGDGKLGTIAEHIRGGVMFGVRFDGEQSRSSFAYFPEELAKGIADSPIARKLYGDRIVLPKDNYIYVRLKNEND